MIFFHHKIGPPLDGTRFTATSIAQFKGSKCSTQKKINNNNKLAIMFIENKFVQFLLSISFKYVIYVIILSQTFYCFCFNK